MGNGNYIIEILKNYPDYNLYLHDNYEVSLNLLKKIDEVTIKKLLEQDNFNKINDVLELIDNSDSLSENEENLDNSIYSKNENNDEIKRTNTIWFS